MESNVPLDKVLSIKRWYLCAPCFLFNQSKHNDLFVKLPFNDWKNASGIKRSSLERHSNSQLHQSCNDQGVTFIAIMENRQQSVKSQLSKSYDKQVQQNTKALL